MDAPAGLPLDPETPAAGDGPRGMSRRTRAWLGMGAVAAALILLTMLSGPTVDPNAPPPAADGTGAEPESGLAVGQPAPLHFTLKDRNGVDVNLESFKGKVILINFWATWCGPCRVEIPDLMELQDQYRNDLVVLGIDVLDEFARVQAFADELKVNYPLLDGTILKKHAGIATKEQFQQYVESAL